MQVIFQTPRLLFRQFTEADAPLVYQLNSNPEVVKYLHEPVLQNETEARKVILDIILPQYKNNLGRWAVHMESNNDFVGWCGLKYYAATGETDLGYRFKQQVWGEGFATEAATYTLDHGFKELNLSLIIGRAHVQNLASLKVLEKIGMQFVKEEIIDDCQVKKFVAKNPY